MIMKKIVIILICFVLASIGVAAQEASVSQLVKYRWVLTSPDLGGQELMIWFTETEFCDSTVFTSSKRTFTFRHRYYLSKTKPEAFEGERVGKSTDGNFLVVERSDNRMSVFKIVSVTDNRLSIIFAGGDVFTFVKE